MRVLRESTVSDFNQHPADRTTILKFNFCYVKTPIMVNECCRILAPPKNMLVYDLNRIFLCISCLTLSQFPKNSF